MRGTRPTETLVAWHEDQPMRLVTHAPWLLAGFTLLAIAVLHMAVQLTTPSDGARVVPGSAGVTAEGLVVAPLRPGGPLHPGDVVVAVDGRPLTAWADDLFSLTALRPAPQHGDVARYEVRRGDERIALAVPLGPYPWSAAVAANAGTVVFALVTLLVGAFLYARRPDVAATRPLFLVATALVAATTWSFGLGVGDFRGAWGFWLYQLGALVGFMLFWLAGLHFAASFPSPLPLLRRRWLVATAYALPFLALAFYLAWSATRADSMLAWVATWGRAADVHATLVLALALGVFVAQDRAQRSAPGRQQIRWVVLAALIAGGAGLALYLLPPLVGLPAVHANVIGAIVSIFPLGIAIAVLRHGLFDIDRLLSHALVYAGLSAAVAAVYVAVVVGVGRLVGPAPSVGLSLLATAVVAVAFHPLRERLQRGVDRRLVGERGEPVRLLGRLGERLEATAEPERVLPALVEVVAEALKLPYVAVALDADGGETIAAEYGRPLPPAVALPLVADGVVVGRLLAARCALGGDLSAADRELLASVARQAGSAVRALRLTRDLERSRRALVTLREEERRRLRRDLHDGLGPTLAAMALKVDAARNLLHRSPAQADALLASVGTSVHDSVGEIRRLVHGLRPPALDELGLVGAVREQADLLAAHGVPVRVVAPDAVPGLSAAVEVAALRIVQEALTNVVRHADAKHCTVTVVASGPELVVVVRDDGRGIAADARYGVGLSSMRERASELGGHVRVVPEPAGGTRVEARLPLGGGSA
jgi:two-component system, NarL family, sensor kinase